MSAIITDQFRILNASNFIDSVEDPANSYYIFVGLSNPSISGYGRYEDWNTDTPNPLDTIDYLNNSKTDILFGRKITSANIRRVVRKIEWFAGEQYDMYRSDYSITNPSALNGAIRLYDTNYYVINSDYRVYICIDNGSSGIKTTGNTSEIEPTFTDLEPTKLSDGYVWKFLYSIAPSDIIKFDSTEYITLPNKWESSTNPQIVAVRENGDSTINENQIKKVYIQNGGKGYNMLSGETYNLVGDGINGTVSVEIDEIESKITDVVVTCGGKNYTYALVDLGTTEEKEEYAELIPIIPPSKGHGFDLYTELGADKVLVYARFDDSTRDFPTDTCFGQVGILKNPTVYDATGINTTVYTASSFSSVYAIKFSTVSGTIAVGDKIQQVIPSNTGRDKIAVGYVISYDVETKVLKYFKDRSLYYGKGDGTISTVDFIGITSYFSSETNETIDFISSTDPVTSSSGFAGTIDTSYGDNKIVIGNKVITLGVTFTGGLAKPEINNKSGEIVYLDNRPVIARNPRQKEDVKIILEF